MGWYSRYSYIVYGTEYVSDTEYYEIQDEEETDDQHGRRGVCHSILLHLYFRVKCQSYYEQKFSYKVNYYI